MSDTAESRLAVRDHLEALRQRRLHARPVATVSPRGDIARQSLSVPGPIGPLTVERIDPAVRPVGAHLEWMRARNLSRSTIHARWATLTALTQACGDPLRATTGDIAALLVARGLQPQTMNVWRSHLSAFYTWALDEGLVARNPVKRIPRAAQPANLPRPIPEASLARAIAAADPRMAAWLTLGAYAGLRVSEIAALEVENVRVDNATIRVVMGKGRKSRVIPMHPRVRAALEPFMRDTGRLWTNPTKVVGLYMNRHLRQLGLPDTAHSLRHRFATAVYEASGGDLNLTRELLGHSSTATTQVYAQVSVSRSTAAVGMLT